MPPLFTIARTVCPPISRGHERSRSRLLDGHEHSTALAARTGTGMASPRCSASSSAWPPRSGLFDRVGPEGAAWLRLAWAGVILLVAGPAPAARLHPARACWPASRSGVVTAGRDHAVHGRRGPAAARHRQRAGVPRPARRRGRAQPRRPAAGLAGCWPRSACCCSPSRGTAASTRSASPSRSARRPAGRRTSCSPSASATRSPGCSGLAVSLPVAGAGRHASSPGPRPSPRLTWQLRADRARAGGPAARRAVQPGDAGAAPAHHRAPSAP